MQPEKLYVSCAEITTFQQLTNVFKIFKLYRFFITINMHNYRATPECLLTN